MTMLRGIAFLLASASVLPAQEPPAAAKVEMDHYIMVFLKKGPKWTSEVTPETTKLGEGHMANIRRMGTTGKLIVAGPFEENADIRGVYIFHCSMEEAKKEAEQDPAVKAGRLVLEFHPWLAPKGVSVVPSK